MAGAPGALPSISLNDRLSAGRDPRSAARRRGRSSAVSASAVHAAPLGLATFRPSASVCTPLQTGCQRQSEHERRDGDRGSLAMPKHDTAEERCGKPVPPGSPLPHAQSSTATALRWMATVECRGRSGATAAVSGIRTSRLGFVRGICPPAPRAPPHRRLRSARGPACGARESAGFKAKEKSRDTLRRCRRADSPSSLGPIGPVSTASDG